MKTEQEIRDLITATLADRSRTDNPNWRPYMQGLVYALRWVIDENTPTQEEW